MSSADRPQATVFISYAHESNALREQVKVLADWLSARGCAVLTDHPHQYRPPAEGWQAWMLRCINEAATVLVVCTPKLKLRYEKNEEPDTGRGASYEGAIVTQHIYDNAMRNTKFFPILPDSGSYEDIPKTLRPWWNGHKFPSGCEGILGMISAEAAAHEFCDSEDVAPSPEGHHHHRLALKLLKAVEATPFFQALGHELKVRIGFDSAPRAPEKIVRRFGECPRDEEDVLELFYSARCALDNVPPETSDMQLRRRCEEAAAALYCLAACCMVRQAAEAAGVTYVVEVPPGSEPIICGIVATALFGGELRLVPPERGDLPSAEYVFEVEVPDGGDQPVGDFERAAFVALFANDREAPDIRTYDGPLDEQHRKKLAARLRTIKRRHRASLAFVVRSDIVVEAYRNFGSRYQAPVMVQESEATAELLGMDVGTLLEEIREFWAELKVMRGESATAPSKPLMPAPEGGRPVSPTGPNITISGGTVAISTGAHSATQAGTGHTANINHRHGGDLAELGPLLRQLALEIDGIPTPKARDVLTAHLKTAEAEAAKGEKADRSVITRALDAIKSVANALETGGKIVSLSSKAYNVVAPALGLPPLPVP